MAETPKVLAQDAPAGATDTDAYTVPGATTTVITSVVVCNRSGSSDTFRLWVAVDGAADSDEQYLYYDFTVPANDSFAATLGITLDASDVVRVRSANGNLSFNVFGIEQT